MFTYLYLVERRVVLAKVHAVRATARPLFGSFFLFAFVVYLNSVPWAPRRAPITVSRVIALGRYRLTYRLGAWNKKMVFIHGVKLPRALRVFRGLL